MGAVEVERFGLLVMSCETTESESAMQTRVRFAPSFGEASCGNSMNEGLVVLSDMPAVLSPAYREACLWQEQVPRKRRSVEDVPDSVDVVVIGAGYCGLNAAATVADAGASVVVLDKEPLGWGASSRNGGMVIPELKSSLRHW